MADLNFDQKIMKSNLAQSGDEQLLRIQVIDLGLIDYQAALEKQLQLVQKKIDGDPLDYFIVCTHPPVVTLGSATKEDDVYSWVGQIINVSRGGRATYHGPNQIIVYPIIDLQKPRKNLPTPNIAKFFRLLEESITKTFLRYGLKASGNTTQDPQNTGVWVLNKKIASLGIGVKKWITYHGLAINLDYDPEAFKGLKPCGFSSDTMTSLEVQLGYKVDRTEFKNRLVEALLNSLL